MKNSTSEAVGTWPMGGGGAGRRWRSAGSFAERFVAAGRSATRGAGPPGGDHDGLGGDLNKINEDKGRKSVYATKMKVY